jgi:hypothetical protein
MKHPRTFYPHLTVYHPQRIGRSHPNTTQYLKKAQSLPHNTKTVRNERSPTTKTFSFKPKTTTGYKKNEK